MENNRSLKVAVVGPGAVGCLLAHGLADSGCNVTLLDYRADRAARMAGKGIRVVTPAGAGLSFPACTSEAVSVGKQDIVIFAVKAFQTEAAVTSAAPMVGERSLVVTLQNGMGYEKYFTLLAGKDRFVSGITALGVTLAGEGEVILAGKGKTVLGFAGKPGKLSLHILDRLFLAFRDSGWEVELVDNPEPARWKKLMVNIGINAITVLACMRNGEILDYTDAIELQESAVREAFSVMVRHCPAAGYSFEEIIEYVRGICRCTAGNISSMLQDRFRGGLTEIDYINGFVCRAGAEYDMDTPVNRTLYSLVNILSAVGWRSCISKEIE